MQALTNKGTLRARKMKRAQILLKADAGLTDAEIMAALDVSRPCVERVRQGFVEGGLPRALNDAPRPGQRRKLDGKQEARLIAEVCSAAPAGHARWTLRLLAGRVVELKLADKISHETVRQVLKKNEPKPWQKREWCIPEVSAEFVAAMEDVLDLYAEPYDPERPKVCFDETPKQLIAETRAPWPARPGQVERYDYEYQRHGSRNLFMFFEPDRGRRHVAVTEHRTLLDFAQQMKWLVDEQYPEAEVVRVVLDNLNTHRAAALYEAFAPGEARRILKRLEFHYTPKHGSWLNMAELELGVFSRDCWDRRIGDQATLARETRALEEARNTAHATVRWRFTTQDARTKLHRLYPSISG